MSKDSTTAQRKAAQKLLNKTAVALGNTDLTPEDLVADLVNAYTREHGMNSLSIIAEGAFLGKNTVQRFGKDGGSASYNPQGQTIWRLLRFFGRELTIKTVHIKPKYQNKPKIV